MPKNRVVRAIQRERVVAYVRVSTSEQAASGLSLSAQRSRIAAFCRARDFELASVEEDAGESGSVPPVQRPGLQRALRLLETRKASGLIVLRLDRLSRSAMHTLGLAELFTRRGWQLISVHENLETNTPAGRLFIAVLAGMNQHEREVIADRTKAALARLAKEGRPRSRMLPFGFRLRGLPRALTVPRGTDRKLVAHHGEQALLQRILRFRAAGLGPRRIAARLNKAGDCNPRTGCEWSPSLIQRLIATADRRQEATSD